MKILHSIYDHPENPWVGGGGAVRAYEINRRLVTRGHAVTTLSGRFPKAVDGVSDGIEFRFLGTDSSYRKSTFSYAYEASRYIARHSREYDLVVEDFAPWNPVFASWRASCPAVLHVNHREGRNIISRFGPAGIPFYVLEKFYPRSFRHVTALSEGTRLKIARPDALVLPAGIGEDIIIRDPAELADEGFIVSVGRLEINNKGLDTLMAAMRQLPGVRLVLAGRGRDEERLRQMAQGLNVEFRGFVSEAEKLDLLRRASLFTLPSRFEGWGIVVLEAAARGTPTVLSALPELSYATDGGYGLSFETGNADALAEALRTMLEDTQRRADMSRKALQAVQRYTWESIAIECEEYFLGILGQTK